ncbi:hypothetical protein [Caldisericum sp.]|uniref:hypothetical protein n=1 Tax=Caldisericum sp. TaxID=2499687 RepID=UPI003D122C40
MENISLKDYFENKFQYFKETMEKTNATHLNSFEKIDKKLDLLERRLDDYFKIFETRLTQQEKQILLINAEKNLKNRIIITLIGFLGAIGGFLGGLFAKGG